MKNSSNGVYCTKESGCNFQLNKLSNLSWLERHLGEGCSISNPLSLLLTPDRQWVLGEVNLRGWRVLLALLAFM